MSDPLRDQLQHTFGLDDFRPAQREVIEDIMAGKDVLCVMPTGAGKSLCYQFPAAIGGGLTLVVSPLISLMSDQVRQLRDEGIPACLLNSTVSGAVRREIYDEIRNGFEGLLYVAPERFVMDDFVELMQAVKPKIFAVDEAHCVSMWGHDFRREYMRLREFREKLGDPPCIALTATATEDVREEIITNLGLRDPSVVVTGFDRPNLSYQCRPARPSVKIGELSDIFRKEPGSGIVYCSTRKNVDEVTTKLSEQLKDRSVFAYHAGMDQAARTANQQRFMNTPGAVAVATNAFGMGINKPDIRLVVHYNIPANIEAYYQEAGRAGRDGRPARCIILFSYADRHTQEFLIDKTGEENPDANFEALETLKQHAHEKLERLIRYCQRQVCRRRMILDYFGDESPVTDCRCDICLGHEQLAAAHADTDGEIVIPDELVLLVRKILSAIARMNGKFGVGMVAEVLKGEESEKLARWGLQNLSVFGLLRELPTKRIMAMIYRVIDVGLAQQRNPPGVVGRPVVELTGPGVAVMKAQELPPVSLVDLLPRKDDFSSKGTGTVRKKRYEAQASEMNADAQSRFEMLRKLRARLAVEKQVPTYVIFHDSVLRSIAEADPKDEAGLSKIKGMGTFKLQEYGPMVLEALQSQ
ncbi:RecQ family ATP-dependent DNA helicase [Humisphaera borealis]|uniref:ATP-dependent DNA helicase RecQ n=1 Tax=Humisphaera borealis TaxID=2807512 RepID=A0A7M2WY61_9BACT|nr:ATP-dependent DNA helicase RecQ [Humisphaera borealis]QOV90359.1 ATP-dependent DNA helicase RecQ [Humisphaera borealis]